VAAAADRTGSQVSGADGGGGAARTVVVGGGVGGLAAAIALASRGHRVDLLEASDRVGGKLGTALLDGVEVDTGPTVLTLPHVLDGILALSGTTLRDELELTEPSPSFRYLYPDGTALDVFPRPADTLASMERTLGRGAADEAAAFLDYSARIWQAAAPHFVFGPAPGPASLLRAGPRLAALLAAVDPLRSMWRAIRGRTRSEHLRWLFARYATYNGSDPRHAPATLNCIAHVELALGGYGVRGGMYEVARALERAAVRVGVRIHPGVRVERIEVEGGRVRGVAAAGGARWPADAVVANADATHVFTDLLPPRQRRHPRGGPSMSGWVGILRARRGGGGVARAAHTVLFPRRYLDEFADIFDRGIPPREPTVYLCAQEVAYGRTGWADHEPIFLMTNEPAVGGAQPAARSSPAEHVLARVRAAGLCDVDDRIVWERAPADLAAQFPGSRGSIYGAASNSALAAFRRPANRVRGIGGLYLASGSAHPGGGVPMCLLSGRAAARALLEDRSEAPLPETVAK
jgi:phytoene desaturase